MKYINTRNEQEQGAYGFFHQWSRNKYSCANKTKTALALVDWLGGKPTKLDSDQWDALNEGRLGELFAQIKQASFFNELSPKLTAGDEAPVSRIK